MSTSVPIPATTPPGIYAARVEALTAEGKHLGAPATFFFVVRNDVARNGPRPILYKFNLFTVHAYNTASTGNPGPGGEWRASYYEWRSPRLTLRRPVPAGCWLWGSEPYDLPLLAWLQHNDYADQVDFCTDMDLHLDTGLEMLSRSNLLLSVGHDEYWSAEMRANAARFRDEGGNIAFLSANTCYWRVTLEDPAPAGPRQEPTSMRCDKGDARSAGSGSGPDAWWKVEGGTTPENQLLGVSTRGGGARLVRTPSVYFYKKDASLPFEEQPQPLSPPLVLQHTDHWCHWAERGTGLMHGAALGEGGWGRFELKSGAVEELHFKEVLVGYEVDGADIVLEKGDPPVYRATGKDGTPPNFAVLGVALLEPHQPMLTNSDRENCWSTFEREPGDSPYAATMGAYSAYGTVFTAATTDWVRTLNYHTAHCWGPVTRKEDNPGCRPAGLTGVDLGHFNLKFNALLGQVRLPPPSDDGGSLCMGNLHVHRITRNVLFALSSREKEAVAVVSLTGGRGPDLLFQHRRTAELHYWKMDWTRETPVREGTGSLLTDASQPPHPYLRVVGAGAFDGDGKPHLLFQDAWTGELLLWRQQGVTRTSVHMLGEGMSPRPSLRAVAIGDLDGDGRPDVLFQDSLTGELEYWLLRDGRVTGSGAMEAPDWLPPEPEWRVVGLGDLNRDGRPDLLFQDTRTGALAWWLLDGTRFQSNGGLHHEGDAPPGTEWRAVAFADMNGDGKPDLLFQHATTGALSYCALREDEATGTDTVCGRRVVLAVNPWRS
ncbi:N,N-dimethylformamidase beta subunit family domain-containing protein [Pyxidicoccus sp. 3LFB2]